MALSEYEARAAVRELTERYYYEPDAPAALPTEPDRWCAQTWRNWRKGTPENVEINRAFDAWVESRKH